MIHGSSFKRRTFLAIDSSGGKRSRTTSAIERAWCRTDAVSDVMSCTPPMKIEPIKIQIKAGAQPLVRIEYDRIRSLHAVPQQATFRQNHG